MKIEAGKVGVVTGAASGLGRSLALQLAERGMSIVLADIEKAPLDEALAEAEALGATAIGVPTDVRSGDQVDALAAATLERFGRVDVVVNNAGVCHVPGPMWSFTVDDWRWILDTNLWGVVNGMRAFVPHLVAQNSGHVVNTASMAGISTSPSLGPYSASKHAVVGLSEGLAADLAIAAPGVRVTIVCPGGMQTNIFTAERNRPAELVVSDRPATDADIGGVVEWMATVSGPDMAPADAAAAVIAGIEADLLHVAPNGSVVGVRTRVEHLLDDLAGA
ncbi:MAG TPA: SDR family NAD(P)-dependent oxidoreductase [Acidimicrobiales bacterium]